MIGEIALFGVFLPVLLVLAVIAILLTGLLTQLLGWLGLYRFLAYRPLVDLALFLLILGLLSLATGSKAVP